MNPIRRRPCADPGQKQVLGEWMTQKGIDSSRPVTEAWCAHSGSEYAHQYSQRKHRKHPASPTQWFYGLFRALPGDHRFVDPVIRATRWRLANLTPASGRQNHTASPSASNALVSRAACVHRTPLHVRDDRDTPLLPRRDGRTILLIHRSNQARYFSRKGWTGIRGRE